ncbi:MAG: hypothetical protein FWF54_02065 [Candidatus Azobacteroides sp.]|nr:hypothetical protein [Candidatus Azobacteroides sp.]
MAKRLDVQNFEQYFGNKEIIDFQDIENYYRTSEPAIPYPTINWRIYKLIQSGKLQRVGKGLYQLGKANIFVPPINNKMQKIEVFLQKRFPFIQYCQWDLSRINDFAHHLINFNVSFVDVEKDAVESAYYTLKERFSKVMAVQNLYDGLSEFNNYIIVRPLITEAPIQKTGKIHTATLEKMLVDLAVDKEFMPFQGSEIYAIFESAMEQYTINQNTLLRYAARKNKKEEIKKIITINRQ